MSERGNKNFKKNSKVIDNEISTIKYLNAEKMLIERLKEQKEVNKEFLAQIEIFIRYAENQSKNNDNNKLESKYLEILEEERSLRDKIRKHLKKNDELIESIEKSNFKNKE